MLHARRPSLLSMLISPPLALLILELSGVGASGQFRLHVFANLVP